jgi:CBS-domain-containing membrane protein
LFFGGRNGGAPTAGGDRGSAPERSPQYGGGCRCGPWRGDRHRRHGRAVATSHYPLVIIPFATSIVLVIGSPEAEAAQPRALVGGHVVATLVGLAMLWSTGPQAWAAAAAAVGLAVLAMVVTGTFHPPAGINPLLVASNLPWSFLLVPVVAGAVLLTAFACIWHRWVRRQPWPQR